MAHDGLRVENIVTSGIFALDGGEWEVDNNIWVVGNDDEVFIIDAAHTAAPIIEAVGGRAVKGILCTHAHNDHITVAPELSKEFDAPIFVHPGDQMLWEETHGNLTHEDLADQQKFQIAGTELIVLNTLDTHLDPAASTSLKQTSSSLETLCSRVGREQLAVSTAPLTPSLSPSRPQFWIYQRKPPCALAMVITPVWGLRLHTWRNGLNAGTKPRTISRLGHHGS